MAAVHRKEVRLGFLERLGRWDGALFWWDWWVGGWGVDGWDRCYSWHLSLHPSIQPQHESISPGAPPPSTHSWLPPPLTHCHPPSNVESWEPKEGVAMSLVSVSMERPPSSNGSRTFAFLFCFQLSTFESRISQCGGGGGRGGASRVWIVFGPRAEPPPPKSGVGRPLGPLSSIYLAVFR